jgi:Sulfotransferase family
VSDRQTGSGPVPGRPQLALGRTERVWCKSLALAQATSVVAAGRGLGPRRRDALPSADYPKIFVVGCPRSGTTWVADILKRHPRVIGGRESHLYPTVSGTIGTGGRSSIGAWARLLYGIERGARLGRDGGAHHYVDRRALSRLGRAVLTEAATDEEATDRLVRAVFDEYFLAAGGTPEHVFVEKTPTHVFYVERLLATFPEAHVVEVVRDGRDVCVSMQLRGRYVETWPTAREAQIALWVRSVRRGLALREDTGIRDRVTRVRYEDLKRDSAGESERLLTAVGLDAPPDVVAGAVASTDIRLYSTGPGEFRHRGEVGTWAEYFTAEDDRLFREMVGDLFTEVGYTYD